MTPIAKFDGVSKSYRRHKVLDRFSLEIPPGAVVGLLGENGAGKTTAIRLLLGLTRPSEGRTEVFGLDSWKHGVAIRRRVGYVAEQSVMYDWMRVWEIGWFTAGFFPDGFSARFEELVDSFSLDRRQRIGELSKGGRARVALALALASDPELLVLDEPTSGLDPIVRRDFLTSVVERAADGKAVLISSHQVGEVERVADIVAILRNGRLQLVESLDVLKTQVRHLTLALEETSTSTPELGASILCERYDGRQWHGIVRAGDPEQLWTLQDLPEVQSVHMRTPSLEEIFVAVMTGRVASANGGVCEKATAS